MRVPGFRPQADRKHAPGEDQPYDAPECYEQNEGPAYSFGFDRRDFFRVLGGGLAIALVFKDATGLQESGGGRGRGGRRAPSDIGSWLHIGADGGVTILTGKVEVGQNIDAGMFEPGDRIDATGKSKGRGFQGGVKRHGFHGGPKTHGQSDRHRAPGSIGAGTSPGRVLKGLKMAGHMGNARVTVRGLEVVQSDPDQNLMFIKGAVPGARNSIVLIRRAGSRKRPLK